MSDSTVELETCAVLASGEADGPRHQVRRRLATDGALATYGCTVGDNTLMHIGPANAIILDPVVIYSLSLLSILSCNVSSC